MPKADKTKVFLGTILVGITSSLEYKKENLIKVFPFYANDILLLL